MKKINYFLMLIALVTITQSCQDSVFQEENISSDVTTSQNIVTNGFVGEDPECVYDVDLSTDEDFLGLNELLFVNNRIIQKLMELYENDDRDGIENYVYQVKGALFNMPDDVTRTTFEAYLNSEIGDAATVTYIVQTINTLIIFMENNSTLFEIEQNELACILASEFNKLHFEDNQSYPRNACHNQCARAFDLCDDKAWNNGSAVFGAGIVGAYTILSWGWWTGAPAGTAAMSSLFGGFIGGIFTTGAGILNCNLDYNYCIGLCNGGDDGEQEGPLPFGDGW